MDLVHSRLAYLVRLTIGLLLGICTAAALAAYPDRPIRILLGFAPGGGSEILLRALTPALGEMLGQHDESIAGAATSDERAERLPEIAPAGEHVVIDLKEMAG